MSILVQYRHNFNYEKVKFQIKVSQKLLDEIWKHMTSMTLKYENKHERCFNVSSGNDRDMTVTIWKNYYFIRQVVIIYVSLFIHTILLVGFLGVTD